MKRIFKYPVPIEDVFALNMPRGAQPLSVQMQGDKPHLWALVDPDAELRLRYFCVIGTGHPIAEVPLAFIGTFQMHGGSLVFHLFEATGEAVRDE